MQAKAVSFRGAKNNPGIRAAYRRVLEAYVRAMRDDMEKAVLDEYAAVEWRMRPKTAQDGFPWRSPLERLNDLIERVSNRWLARFDTLSRFLSGKFVKKVLKGVQNSRQTALADAGVYVKVSPSRYTDERVQALISANVDLIKSIPRQYLSRVKQQVTEAMANGTDRAGLAKALHKDYGVTERRAAFIARDQTQKATQALAMTTDADLGVKEGIWRHVPGRKSSRPTHVRMNGKRFDLEKGLWDEAVKKWVKPGELVACACVYAPVWPERYKA